MADKIEKTDEEWQSELTPEQFHVTRQGGTERPFGGKYNDFKDKGLFACSCCGNPLFDSDTKFDSGTGWPSFWGPIAEGAVATEEDHGLFMRRTEVLCAACDSHLGHVFEDGPAPTGQRYCMNSVSMKLDPKEGDE